MANVPDCKDKPFLLGPSGSSWQRVGGGTLRSFTEAKKHREALRSVTLGFVEHFGAVIFFRLKTSFGPQIASYIIIASRSSS